MKKFFKTQLQWFTLLNLLDSSVNLSLRFWSKNEDYWDMYFFVMEEIKLRFDQNGIEIPFPQRDIYVKKSYI